MGLRDSYITALVARCVVAVPRECNTQQPAKLLRVAPPRQTQHATSHPALATAATATATALHATNDATTMQHAQPGDHEAKVEGSALSSADGVPYWRADDWAGLPPWSDAEIVTFDKRVARCTWLGYPDPNGRAERLLHRDRDADDRRLCIECQHAGPGWRCAKRGAFLLDHLHRCLMFKEKPL